MAEVSVNTYSICGVKVEISTSPYQDGWRLVVALPKNLPFTSTDTAKQFIAAMVKLADPQHGTVGSLKDEVYPLFITPPGKYLSQHSLMGMKPEFFKQGIDSLAREFQDKSPEDLIKAAAIQDIKSVIGSALLAKSLTPEQVTAVCGIVYDGQLRPFEPVRTK